MRFELPPQPAPGDPIPDPRPPGPDDPVPPPEPPG
jgi:hypothetical protein